MSRKVEEETVEKEKEDSEDREEKKYNEIKTDRKKKEK